MNFLKPTKLAVLGAVGLSAIGFLGIPESAKAASLSSFPKAGTDIIWHELTEAIDLGDDGIIDEEIVFNGKMTIERGNPYTNSEGFRQIDFLVTDWVASAYSTLLNQNIVFTLSKDIEQPVSQIVAEQIGQDFPAKFLFNVIFDIQANNQIIFQRHHGRPMGGGFMTVPPDGNSPTITTFEQTQIVINQPGIGFIRFIPLECNDTMSVTVSVPEPNTEISVAFFGLIGLLVFRRKRIFISH